MIRFSLQLLGFCLLLRSGLTLEPSEHHGEAPEGREPSTNETSETNGTVCCLPMKVGPCRAAFPRYFYNVTSQTCSQFIYGGCGSNGNNFESQKACEDACHGVTGPVLPDESTPARSHSLKSSRMAPGGPAETAPLQENVTVLPSLKKASDEDKVSADYRDRCTVTPDSGPCRAAFPMFYYNPNTATCQSFVYGGCRGNANRYSTREECMSSCSGDGSFDSRGKTRNRWTAALFLFVTLAAISALLLATLIIITLRRHRLSRRPSSVSDKEELLPDPDEQSSVDSLPVPESPEVQQKA